MFSENIINLTCCIIIKMLAFRVDKFSAGRTKCRSSMLKRTWWNRLALYGVLKPYLGLDLIETKSLVFELLTLIILKISNSFQFISEILTLSHKYRLSGFGDQ